MILSLDNLPLALLKLFHHDDSNHIINKKVYVGCIAIVGGPAHSSGPKNNFVRTADYIVP